MEVLVFVRCIFVLIVRCVRVIRVNNLLLKFNFLEILTEVFDEVSRYLYLCLKGCDFVFY